jgi:hypothetical protein
MELFEGSKAFPTVRNKDDKATFKTAMKVFKFSMDLDLVIFCAALGLYVSKSKQRIKPEAGGVEKLVSISTMDIPTAKMFDYLIIAFLESKTERMKEFEKYFFTGFVYLKEWMQKNEGDIINTLDAFEKLIFAVKEIKVK